MGGTEGYEQQHPESSFTRPENVCSSLLQSNYFVKTAAGRDLSRFLRQTRGSGDCRKYRPKPPLPQVSDSDSWVDFKKFLGMSSSTERSRVKDLLGTQDTHRFFGEDLDFLGWIWFPDVPLQGSFAIVPKDIALQ